jgi:hypothetical protein
VIDVERGEVLTPGALNRARRRLDDVPAIRTATLEFVPVTSGRAEVRAAIDERGLFPTSLNDLAELGGRAIFQRDPRVSIGSMTGSGERLDVQYRFRPGRPRLGLTLSAPAPWRGVLSVQGLWERQPFDSPLVETSERTTGRVAWTDWMSGRFQVSVRGGADRWQDIGTRAMVGAMAHAASLDDRVSVRFDVDTWMGDTRFSSAKAIAKYSSSTGGRAWCSWPAPAPALRVTGCRSNHGSRATAAMRVRARCCCGPTVWWRTPAISGPT